MPVQMPPQHQHNTGLKATKSALLYRIAHTTLSTRRILLNAHTRVEVDVDDLAQQGDGGRVLLDGSLDDLDLLGHRGQLVLLQTVEPAGLSDEDTHREGVT